MHVFVLGATGFIGSAVVRVLIQRGHRLTGLTRSETSAVKLRSAGCQPLMGDIGRPTAWIDQLPPVDAVVHTACDVNTDMGAVDRRLLDALLARLAARSNKTRFVYTGGSGGSAQPLMVSRPRKHPSHPWWPSRGWSLTASASWPRRVSRE
jgi:nucleoside-diphosphate-sugar epimerase